MPGEYKRQVVFLDHTFRPGTVEVRFFPKDDEQCEGTPDLVFQNSEIFIPHTSNNFIWKRRPGLDVYPPGFKTCICVKPYIRHSFCNPYTTTPTLLSIPPIFFNDTLEVIATIPWFVYDPSLWNMPTAPHNDNIFIEKAALRCLTQYPPFLRDAVWYDSDEMQVSVNDELHWGRGPEIFITCESRYKLVEGHAPGFLIAFPPDIVSAGTTIVSVYVAFEFIGSELRWRFVATAKVEWVSTLGSYIGWVRFTYNCPTLTGDYRLSGTQVTGIPDNPGVHGSGPDRTTNPYLRGYLPALDHIFNIWPDSFNVEATA